MTPGTVFAERFEIERAASAGGMGAVYRARDLREGGHVALKLLREGGPDEILRFEREASILLQLDHPGIVRCLAHGHTADGAAFLAMEWLEGEDLAARLARGRLSVDETITLGSCVAEALAAAHARGIVHRDVKPANLFLPGRVVDRVKVIDFGIAHGAHDARPTVSGAVIGTPSYMAPEQARGEPDVDLRADLFSLGCVLFECLAGRPPFEGSHAMAILAKILFEEAPALRGFLPGVPPALERLIGRMLAKKADERPAGAAEVAAALVASPESTGGAPFPAPAASLTGRELRLVSVIVARAPVRPEAVTLALSDATGDLTALRQLLSPFGARLEPLADGSRIAVIGGSEGATDQAARAARCALAMRAALQGPVAVATGRGMVEGELPMGEAIDRAVALLRAEQRRDRAEAAMVVLDEVTAGLLDARFEVGGEAGRRELREELSAFSGGARNLLGKPTPFVGRDREVASLEAVFAHCAAESVSRAVLVTGPPGIGKSRLGHELLSRTESRGEAAAIWVARGDPMGAGSPQRLLAQLVADAAGIAPSDALATKQDKLRARARTGLAGDDAERVAEFLGELLDAPFPDEHRLQLRAARSDARLLGDQIRLAALDLLTADSARGPVLLLIDDLHHSDPSSVAFIDAALRLHAERPLMVLALARPDVRDRFPRLWTEGRTEEIRLSELSRRASERLARLALGERASPALLERVVAQAGGNAFYLEELLRAAAEGQGDALPGTVLAMVQSRLSSLSPEARRAARAGSIFGESFWSGGVRALLGGSEAGDEQALGELIAREIVGERRESRFSDQAEYGFRQAVLREAAYSLLTDRDRTVGHALAGGWLEQAGEHDAMVLADHFERGAEPTRAALWYRRAAEQAHVASELTAVIARARQAAELGAAGEVLGGALLLRGEAHLWRGEVAEARPCLADAMRLVPHGSALWFQAAMGTGWEMVGAGDGERLRALASEVRRAIPDPPTPPSLIAAARIAVQLVGLGLSPEAKPLFDLLAPLLADPACDPLVAPHLHDLMGHLALSRGDEVASIAAMTRATACFEALGDVRQAARNRVNVGFVLVTLGRLEQGEAELRASLASGERLGVHYQIASAQSNLSLALLWRGCLAEARVLQEQAIATLAAQGDRPLECACHAYLAAILLELHDLEGAGREAAEAARMSDVAPPLRAVVFGTLARVSLARGRPDEALEAAKRAMRALDHEGGVFEGEALARLYFAEARFATGDEEGARAAIAAARDRLLERAAALTDPEWRRGFLENVFENARTLALAEAWIVRSRSS